MQFKKNDISIKLAYTEAGMSILACEITRNEELSQIREKTYEKWNASFIWYKQLYQAVKIRTLYRLVQSSDFVVLKLMKNEKYELKL